jgi:hypothetical protein
MDLRFVEKRVRLGDAQFEVLLRRATQLVRIASQLEPLVNHVAFGDQHDVIFSDRQSRKAKDFAAIGKLRAKALHTIAVQGDRMTDRLIDPA